MEYIEGTGSQYLYLGVIFDGSPLGIRMDATFSIPNSEQDLIGSVITSGSDGSFTIGSFRDRTIFLYNKPNQRIDINFNNVERKYEIVATVGNGQRTLTVNGSSATESGVTANNGNLYVFRGGENYMPASLKLHYLRIESDGVLVIDAIPVVVDNVACMYNRVTRQLLTNQGTGNFIPGPQKT